jgi:hypothetical protein
VIGIGDLAAILTVAGVSIYVLGLIGLAVTIRLRLASNISIAWYAVSLLPRTVVAGHGVRIWLTLPIGLIVVVLLAAYWLATRPDPDSLWLAETYLISGIFFVVLIIALAVCLRIVRRQRLLQLATPFNRFLGSETVVMAVIVAMVGAWWAMSVAAQIIGEAISKAQESPLPTSYIVLGITLLVLGGFLVGLPAALTVEPPLPHVEITRKNKQSVARGRLVSHSEGFWHLFVGSNSDKALGLRNMSYEFLSIPDAEVSVVRIIRAADTGRTEAAKVDTEKDK